MRTSNKRIWAALALVARALLAALAVIAFQNIRLIPTAVFIILFVLDLSRLIKRRKNVRTAFAMDCAALVLIALVSFPCCEQTEKLRFEAFEASYTEAVDYAAPFVGDSEDTSWSEYKLNSFLPLAVGNKAVYFKHGGSFALYFPTSVSFFNSMGYIYFSDASARDFFEHPSKYDAGLSTEKSYDYIADYDKNWAYIKLY